jgi:two-component system chemotaxis response regulator CheB
MRGILRKLFLLHAEAVSKDLPLMELCGVARDGVECLEQVEQLRPDVLVLDLEMPLLNGLEVLDRLRTASSRLPVIMCSSYTEHGARSTLEALGRGASDYVTKPSSQRDFFVAMESLSQQLLPRIAALAKDAEQRERPHSGLAMGDASKKVSSEISARESPPIEVVVIGLSTGGPSALELFLPNLAKNFPVPVLIVQHMPKLFTAALAERLDKCCGLRVEQAYDNAPIRPGMVWLAPGDAHMEVAPRYLTSGEEGKRTGVGNTRVRLHHQEPLNHCKPSADYLFFSAARTYGAGTLAMVMTGMGSDGLNGARAVRESGGVVLAQDEATSAVWGMPGRVSEAGIANATLPLSVMAGAVNARVSAARPSGLDTVGGSATVARREAPYGLL